MTTTTNAEIIGLLATALESVASSLRKTTGTASGPLQRTSDLPPARVPRTHANLYFAGTPGLAAWCDSANAGLSPDQKKTVVAFKVGMSRQALKSRQDDLQADAYAGFVRVGDRYEKMPGFDRWEMRRVSPVALPPGSEEIVLFEPRCLSINLQGRDFDEVEQAFRKEMAPLRLATWARTPDGSRILQRAGMVETAADFWTGYRYDAAAAPVFKKASEIYVVRPTVDLPKIVAKIVRAIEMTPARVPGKRLVNG